MDINNISSIANVDQRNTGNLNDQFLDPNLFLKLLMTQMQYQDPLGGGSDPTQQMAQMASFAMIEQLNNLSDITEQNMMLGVMGQTSDLITTI